MPPDEKPVEDPKKPEPTPEETPTEVLAPEPELTPEPTPDPEPAEPSADELRTQLAAKDARIAELEGQPAAEPAAPTPGQRVSMAQVFVQRVIPEAKKMFVEATEPGKQFEIMAETANQLVGAVMADQVTPAIQQLAAANVELMNELEIRDLRSDPEFASVEASVREQLRKSDWKTRAGSTAATDIFHRLRGSKRNGTVKPATPAAPISATRAALKDLAAGGGASPKPAGVRLTTDQESDFQKMVETGWPGNRAEYYAKWKSRADQAKAQGKKIPATYRG